MKNKSRWENGKQKYFQHKSLAALIYKELSENQRKKILWIWKGKRLFTKERRNANDAQTYFKMFILTSCFKKCILNSNEILSNGYWLEKRKQGNQVLLDDGN